MSKVKIELSGIAAELVLGNYMPTDATIMNNWEDFYHYNDLIHVSHLLSDYVNEINIVVDNEILYNGKIPAANFQNQKSFSPVMVHRAVYLRTECVEEAKISCEFEIEEFDKTKLVFETQEYDLLFKVGGSFIAKILYNGTELEFDWLSGKSLGNICLLCRFENGYLMPIYDAIKKIEAKLDIN